MYVSYMYVLSTKMTQTQHLHVVQVVSRAKERHTASVRHCV